jgi:hypothetical protein
VVTLTMRRQYLCALALLTFGCGGGEVATTPTTPTTPAAPVAARLSAVSPEAMSADPGAYVAAPPVVIVTDSTGKRGVPGVQVLFTVTGGGGIVGQTIAYSDDGGFAAARSWQTGDTAITNTVVASATGLAPIVFIATARRMIARFDLLTIGNVAPPFYSPDSTRATVGGHYTLYNDSSATLTYDVVAVTPSGFTPLPNQFTLLRYLLKGQLNGVASISFYYATGSLPFAFGDCLNGFMTVNPADIDFDAERYQLAK